MSIRTTNAFRFSVYKTNRSPIAIPQTLSVLSIFIMPFWGINFLCCVFVGFLVWKRLDSNCDTRIAIPLHCTFEARKKKIVSRVLRVCESSICLYTYGSWEFDCKCSTGSCLATWVFDTPLSIKFEPRECDESTRLCVANVSKHRQKKTLYRVLSH